MKWRGLNLVLIISVACSLVRPAFSQLLQPPEIINWNTESIKYCSDSVFVAPEITIQNLNVTDSAGGIKVSVINYNKDEDTLGYIPVQGITYTWNDVHGYLLIRGIVPDERYQDAVRKIYYKNVAEKPTLGIRKFTISLSDADYLPLTGHFYEYIKKLNITWTESKTAAESMKYYGLQGYMATITSAEENDFIGSKLDGIGWIGASDSLDEGVWKWVAGPENGQQFWEGNQNGQAMNGMFSYWAQGEPNNAHGGEQYAHINQHPNKAPKSWNDLRNDGSGSNPLYYTPQGYVVEFGGMPGDSIVKLVALSEIEVAKIAFSDKREYDICFGSGTEINIFTLDAYEYLWTPDVSIDNIYISNPFVNPTEDKTYKVVGRYGSCIDSSSFYVNVNPIPVSNLDDGVNTVCKGDSVLLDPGEHESYLWNTGDYTRFVEAKAEGLYAVELTNNFGCSVRDTTIVQWSSMPKLDFTVLQTLICGAKEIKLNLNFDGAVDSTYFTSLQGTAIIDDNSSINPHVSVPDYGTYQMRLFYENQNHCTAVDTFNLDFHNQPSADFLLDDATCRGYNLELKYEGKNFEPAHFYWFSNDTVFVEGIGLQDVIIPLGYRLQNRTVGLQVSEQGCVSEKKVEMVTVVPEINFWSEEENEGCSPLKLNFSNSDTEDIEKYFWEFGDGTTSEEKEPEHTFLNESKSDKEYHVKLSVVSSEGCENTGYMEEVITVFPIPSIGLNFNENECNNEYGVVWYEGSVTDGDTFFWDLSDFQTDEIIQNPGKSAGPLEFRRMSSSNVDIGLRMITKSGCTSESVIKTWKRKPLFRNSILLDNAAGCPPLDISFSASPKDGDDILNYQWSIDHEIIGNGAEFSKMFIFPDKKYDLSIIATSDITQCSDTMLLPEAIYTYPKPKAFFEANPSTVLISDPVINFENKSEGAESYKWDFMDNSWTSNEENPLHQFSKIGFYHVNLSAWNELGCMDSISRVVTIGFDKIYPPNAFSPNAVLEEDREFRLYAEGMSDGGYRLQIFNRWGEIIFESNSPDVGWTGKMKNNNLAPTGVYPWVVQYMDILGKKHNQQGTVTLLF